jgi:hypothetical protein
LYFEGKWDDLFSSPLWEQIFKICVLCAQFGEFFLFVFLPALGLEFRAFTLSHSTSHIFVKGLLR